ncbi:DUF2264 domain-containing protein [Actinacidiphila bryophytorum]|uniref:DUF2264 domain-containing protein n=1 Tax=Actinacidiphila bryophytorum TaxID=1436133 RepID=UPI002176A0A4|nr:DUF2264 domain-containing protein [Actinacidiphila bryophytorum]UWE10611.1 DUF2264 domain-containing protein [Actinacidiphila bryophytorum]
MPPALPPEDRGLSPYTGWTRAHWAALADRMLAAVAPYRSPGGALVGLPGPASSSGVRSDGLEGFARTFLLAGFRVAGEGGADPAGLLETYARGLAAGTDPHSPEAWPRPDKLGQAKVEAASVALVLQLTRPWLWDALDDAVRERVLDWLGSVVGQDYPPINWVWFRIVVESFLREAGGDFSVADIKEDLAVHASLRRAGGWLSDGQERAYDHYTGWALHLYPLLWTRLFDVTGTLCPAPLRQRWEEDLAAYLDDAVRLVGADGSPLLQGRSLTYRFAAAAPLWVGAVSGAGGQAPGLLRRAASGILRHFTDRGALEPDGLLTLGWHGEWPGLRQSYSGPGSPYWAAKGMLGLMLPADHPVWTSVEEPLPVETGDVSRVVAAPGWLVSARRRDGIALVVNHGTDHARPGDVCADSPLYARLGYSTATVPPLTGPTTADPVDNSVAVLDDAGRATHRSGFTTLYADELPGGALAGCSRGTVHWVDTAGDDTPDHGSGRRGPAVPGPLVTVASVLRDGVEVRLVRLDPPPGGPGTASPSWRAVRLGGWPLAAAAAPESGSGSGRGRTASAEAATADLRSRVGSLLGFTESGVSAENGTSPLARWTAVPWLATSGPAPLGRLLAAVVTLDRGTPTPPDPALSVRDTPDGGHDVTVTWPDGHPTTVTVPSPG